MRIEKATKEGRLYKCGYCDKLFIYLTLTLEDLSGPKLEKKTHRYTLCNRHYSRNADVIVHLSVVRGSGETHESRICGTLLSSHRKMR